MILSDIYNLFCDCPKTSLADKDAIISRICYDSRLVCENSVFVAITGFKSDGHDYIQSSIKQGCIAVICENQSVFENLSVLYPNVLFVLVMNTRIALATVSKVFTDNACEKLKIIGLTGTKGKTSTSFMIQKILNEANLPCGLIGTTGAYFNNFYKELNHSTPESLDLHLLFSQMLSLGARYVVMEVSSQALMLNRVYGINFDTAIFTNITPDHIGDGEHTDFEHYLSCKAKLFTMCNRGVINIDSDRVNDIIDVCKQNNVDIISYSANDSDADYFAFDEQFVIDGGMVTKYIIKEKTTGNIEQVKVSVPGKFSVFNSLCAYVVGKAFSVASSVAQKALTDVKVIGRIEPVYHEKLQVPVIIDYAHNAVSLESLFTAVKAYSPERIICVFGCGGNRSKLRRYEMGEISGKYADLSIITEDNSRFEELDDIISDILIGMSKTSGKYEIVKSRKDAIYRALDISKKGDIILLAGKGQETYLDIKGVKTHFDEREIVLSYFDDDRSKL